MTITSHIISNESPTEELALLEVGEWKSGKSWLAGTAPGTILFLDFDLRLGALRAHPNAHNIYGLSFSDPTDSKTMPTAMNDALQVMTRIEASPKLSYVHESFAGIDKPIDTIVIDSVQTVSNAARNFVLANATDAISRNFVIGGRIYRVPASYTAWGSEMELVTNLVLQARALLHCKQCLRSVTSWVDPTGRYKAVHTHELLQGTNQINPKAVRSDHEPQPRAMNVIVTLHEGQEEDPRSTDKNPIFTGKVVVYPWRYRVLLTYFNEVWRLTREHGRIPIITVDPDGKFLQAATALGLSPSGKFPANIQTILNDAKSLRKSQPQLVQSQAKGN